MLKHFSCPKSALKLLENSSLHCHTLLHVLMLSIIQPITLFSIPHLLLYDRLHPHHQHHCHHHHLDPPVSPRGGMHHRITASQRSKINKSFLKILNFITMIPSTENLLALILTYHWMHLFRITFSLFKK